MQEQKENQAIVFRPALTSSGTRYIDPLEHTLSVKQRRSTLKCIDYDKITNSGLFRALVSDPDSVSTASDAELDYGTELSEGEARSIEIERMPLRPYGLNPANGVSPYADSSRRFVQNTIKEAENKRKKEKETKATPTPVEPTSDSEQ